LDSFFHFLSFWVKQKDRSICPLRGKFTHYDQKEVPTMISKINNTTISTKELPPYDDPP